MAKKLLPTPAEILDYLNKHVSGQDEAKRIIASAAYFHYLKLATNDKNFINKHSNNILILGPSGTGKTFLIKNLAEYLQVPFYYCNAASLTASGYVGTNLPDCLQFLCKECNFSEEKINRSIIFFDEFDKLANHDINGCGDISGKMVQEELLSFLDGNTLSVVTKLNKNHRAITINSSNIFIIAAGAFQGIEKITEKRIKKRSHVGFYADSKNDSEEKEQIISEDLIEYGFLPEIIGRFPNIARLYPLKAEEIKNILKNNSLLTFKKNMYQFHGISLTITDEGFEKIAEEAAKNPMGMRGVLQEINNKFLDTDYKIFELAKNNCNELIFDGTSIIEKYNPAPPPIAIEKLDELRTAVFKNLTSSDEKQFNETSEQTVSKNFTSPDEKKLTEEELLEKRLQQTNYNTITGNAKKWFDSFLNANKNNKQIIIRFLDNLLIRKASISEFFLSYIYSNTNNIEANFLYLDYCRLKKASEENNPKVLLEEKLKEIRYEKLTGSAKKWFDSFLDANKDTPEIPLRLIKELLIRKASISEFFLSYIYSKTNDIEANLYYFDYRKKQTEKKLDNDICKILIENKKFQIKYEESSEETKKIFTEFSSTSSAENTLKLLNKIIYENTTLDEVCKKFTHCFFNPLFDYFTYYTPAIKTEKTNIGEDVCFTEEIKKKLKFDEANENKKIIFKFLCQYHAKKIDNIESFFDFLLTKNISVTNLANFAIYANTCNTKVVQDYIKFLYARFKDPTSLQINDSKYNKRLFNLAEESLTLEILINHDIELFKN